MHYPPAIQELESSKEELQSLNEALTAVNDELQNALDLQRTTSDDLRNVLFSTEVATLFLDSAFNIRFFTPATKSLFTVAAGDVGRPLAEVGSLTLDDSLLVDAAEVLRTQSPLEKEIRTAGGAWYVRRILPYRTADNSIDGTVITFIDVTEPRRIADSLQTAERQAQSASAAKSRFLAAASHDLRQPLQTLVLLQGRLATAVEGERAQKLVARLDDTLGAMSRMLNALLDMNQIEAGMVRAEKVNFSLDALFEQMKEEFTYAAQAHGLHLKVVPSGLWVHSDPRLLEQIVRNLLSNALKYTTAGKILLGCRRCRGMARIEVWDTGAGIPSHDLDSIFDEYQQLGNAPRERTRGLGLGLSIVQRIGELLGHAIHVRSRPNVGSVFSVTIPRASVTASAIDPVKRAKDHVTENRHGAEGRVLVVEDDSELRELLALCLADAGYRTFSFADGHAALKWMRATRLRPDIILADFNLPNGVDGLQLTETFRKELHREIPAVILTGDISTTTLREINLQNCVHVNKPVRDNDLIEILEELLQVSRSSTPSLAVDSSYSALVAPRVFVVDDDSHVREAIRGVLEDAGREVDDYASCEEFLDAYKPGGDACLLVDAYLPGMSGLELLVQLSDAPPPHLPAIMITGKGDVAIAVQAMKAGAVDFIEKPIRNTGLLASVDRALDLSGDALRLAASRDSASVKLQALTPREHQVMEMVLSGSASKKIAAVLGISQRTVENHRATVMKKTGAGSLPALARLAVAAVAHREHPQFVKL